MSNYYLFPFGKIKQGSKIVIYGAGNVGQWYLSQLRDTSYAEVVAVVDRSWQKYPQMGARMISPEGISDTDFENVVIAIEKPEIAQEIKKSLIERYNIPADKILWGCEHISVKPQVLPPFSSENGVSAIAPFAFQTAEHSLAVFLPGGLGDDIISKRFLEALREFEDKLAIDLYCGKNSRGFAEAIFQEPWYQIYDVPVLYEWNKAKYDIALKADYILRFDNISEDSLRDKAPRLFAIVEKLRDSVESYGLDAKPYCEYFIHFARSQYLGWSAYAAMGHGLLSYETDHVHIPLQETGKKRFQELGLPQRYITINYGWGTKELRKSLPAKVWPLHYYTELISKLHSEFPGITLVQLGTSSSAIINGIDKFVQGESLETVKFVLMHSSLHIDCEGGLVHLATQLGTKCAVLFGPTPESYFGYRENINICADVCRPCCYVYDDFTLCARNQKAPECMLAITPSMVMEAIRDYLDRQLSVNGTVKSR